MFLILSAVALASGAATTEPARIIVQGQGSVRTAPDIAQLSYDIRGEGATNDQAISDLVAKSATVEKALRSVDPTLDLHSASVSVQIVRGKDCGEDRYEETVHLSTGECGIKGYVALQDFNAKTSRVADAGTLVGLAGRKGAYNPKIESFGLADEKDAKRRAIAAALEDARAKAGAVAVGSGSRIGSILSVSLDNARDQEIIVTGSAMYASRAAERDVPITVSVNPTPIETTARVTVSYALAR